MTNMMPITGVITGICLSFQVNRLDCEVTRLRAQLERGEAQRQNLEFELAKARREINTEKKSAGERENLVTEINEEMKRG